MSDNKGLVVSNVSGSDRGTIHSNAALISVTGAISIARSAANNAHAMPGNDVFFHVAGTPNDNLTVSVFGGDVVLSGSLSVEGASDSSFDSSLRVGNDLIVADKLTVTGSARIRSTLTLGDEIGTINVGDPDGLGTDALEIRTFGALRLSGSVQVPLDLNVTGSASFLDGIEVRGNVNVSTGSVTVDASHSLNTNVVKSLVPSGAISFLDSAGDRKAHLNAANAPLAMARVDASGSEVTGRGFDSVTRTTDPGVYSLTFEVPTGVLAGDLIVLINMGDQASDPGILMPSLSVASGTCTVTVRAYDLSGAAANVSFSIAAYALT